MATKKRKGQLENLLDWEREGGRLPETTELFNRGVSDTFFLRESDNRRWVLEAHTLPDEDGAIGRKEIFLRHETLVQLALTILDAVQFTNKRRIDGND